jgi:hypothetical protein
MMHQSDARVFGPGIATPADLRIYRGFLRETLVNCGNNHYWHWLVDGLAPLAALPREFHSIPVVLHHGHSREGLAWLGFNSVVELAPGEYLEVDRAFYFQPQIWAMWSLPAVVAEFRAMCLKQWGVPWRPSRWLFLNRDPGMSRHITNAREVVLIF